MSRLQEAVAALNAHREQQADQADLFTSIETVADHADTEWRDEAHDLHVSALERESRSVN